MKNNFAPFLNRKECTIIISNFVFYFLKANRIIFLSNMNYASRVGMHYAYYIAYFEHSEKIKNIIG